MMMIITTPLATVMRDATILTTVVMTFLKLDVLVSWQANSLFALVHTYLHGYAALVHIILREMNNAYTMWNLHYKHRRMYFAPTDQKSLLIWLQLVK